MILIDKRKLELNSMFSYKKTANGYYCLLKTKIEKIYFDQNFNSNSEMNIKITFINFEYKENLNIIFYIFFNN